MPWTSGLRTALVSNICCEREVQLPHCTCLCVILLHFTTTYISRTKRDTAVDIQHFQRFLLARRHSKESPWALCAADYITIYWAGALFVCTWYARFDPRLRCLASQMTTWCSSTRVLPHSTSPVTFIPLHRPSLSSSTLYNKCSW
jgi:hypothetical protein